jgi:hypothetical protein
VVQTYVDDDVNNFLLVNFFINFLKRHKQKKYIEKLIRFNTYWIYISFHDIQFTLFIPLGRRKFLLLCLVCWSKCRSAVACCSWCYGNSQNPKHKCWMGCKGYYTFILWVDLIYKMRVFVKISNSLYIGSYRTRWCKFDIIRFYSIKFIHL